eukprot:352242-Chlamydomonas_euryale.AAC.7
MHDRIEVQIVEAAAHLAEVVTGHVLGEAVGKVGRGSGVSQTTNAANDSFEWTTTHVKLRRAGAGSEAAATGKKVQLNGRQGCRTPCPFMIGAWQDQTLTQTQHQTPKQTTDSQWSPTVTPVPL